MRELTKAMDERYIRNEKIAIRQRKKKKKRKRAFIVMCFILCCIGIILVVFKAPFFNITEVSCTGQKTLTGEQIVKKSEITAGQNIFSISMSNAAKKISELAYVNTVEVKRVFPGKIKITVTECTPRAYVSVGKKYALIDYNGKILELTDKNDKYSVMTIKGVKVTNARAGSVIENKNDERISYCTKILEILEKNKMISKVNELDLTKITGIKINYNDMVYINCGSFDNYDNFKYKLDMCSHLIENEISPYEKVEVDLTMEETIVRPYEDEETKKKRLKAEEEAKKEKDKEEEKEEEDNLPESGEEQDKTETETEGEDEND